ncbi:MAG: lantibiotic protection ABC transporter ATP-binding protein [Clostridium sp.]|nr:lantibiotic protection ABC transporter ATP-binding protein [Clostridium sp.]
MEQYILRTENLCKRFGKQLAVNNISLCIKANTIYGLLGPNGAGKSTTLKMITGLLRHDKGEIFINGEKWRRKHLENIGALIEYPAIYGNLTAVENLMIHTKLMGLQKNEIDRVLGVVNLKDTGKKLSAQFSMGMKQRLGMAIALLGDPKLLILDEPTNGLDPIAITELRDLIRSFPKLGITVILSSHVLTEVSQLVDHIGIVNNGELKYQGAIHQNENLEDLFMKVVKGE